MKFKTEKNLKIVNELISYCYHYGSDEVSMDIKNVDDSTRIHIKAKLTNFSEDNLQNLIDTLNVPRQHEVEQYYWHLGGESAFDSELSLVGMMVDESNISFSDNVLNLEVIRKGAN
ncbi:MAG: hypothetical protein ACRC2K_06180 [Clostridium sp.]